MQSGVFTVAAALFGFPLTQSPGGTMVAAKFVAAGRFLLWLQSYDVANDQKMVSKDGGS